MSEPEGTPPAVDRTDALLNAGVEIQAKRKGGWPKGKPRGPRKPVAAVPDEGTTKNLAPAVLAIFGLLGFFARMFGYEYAPKMTTAEAEEGAAQLAPLADRLGFLITLATWIGFPLWLMTQMSEKFRKKTAPAAGPNAAAPAAAPGLNAPSIDGQGQPLSGGEFQAGGVSQAG